MTFVYKVHLAGPETYGAAGGSEPAVSGPGFTGSEVTTESEGGFNGAELCGREDGWEQRRFKVEVLPANADLWRTRRNCYTDQVQ